MQLSNVVDAVQAEGFRWTNIDNVLPVLYHWAKSGQKVALVTLVGIDGASPRSLGSQMAVSESGQAFGHISGGCLKQEVVNKAIETMKSGENTCIRYGAGSKYIDIVLPCGSGLDLYFDQSITLPLIQEACSYANERRPFTLTTDMDKGISALTPPCADTVDLSTHMKDGQFIRVFKPKIKLAIMGTDPAVITMARLGISSDMDVHILSPDEEILDTARHEGFDADLLTYGQTGLADDYDRWTASVMLFHDHNWEVPLMQQVLESNCFYIGAQGSRSTHQVRVDALNAQGIADEEIARIKGPIGILDRSKGPAELAISALAEIVDTAKKSGISE